TLLKANRAYFSSPAVMHAGAELDRPEVVRLLLELGFSPDVPDPKRGNQRPLHVAAYNGSKAAASVLLESGAEVDPMDSMHYATPLWFAIWARRPEMIELLRSHSRDIWALTFIGEVERVKNILRDQPKKAQTSGETPLFWLPEDEQKAIELIEVFLSHGTDLAIRREDDGLTAAEVAQRRGLDLAAQKLESARNAR